MTSLTTMPTAKTSIAVIMLFQVSALFVREFIRLKLVQAGTPPRIAQDQSAWIGFGVLVILMWPYWQRHRSFLVTGFLRPKTWVGLALPSVVIGICMHIAGWGVAFFAASLPSNRISGAWVAIESGLQWQCADAGLVALGIVTMAFATPVLEEAINRGYILGALIKQNSRYPVLISASLFAVLHRPDGMLTAFMFGIVVAIQMMHCRTLWGPIIAHSTFNILVVFDVNCFNYPAFEVTLLSLPPSQLGSIGIGITVLSLLAGLRVARWAGAGAQ